MSELDEILRLAVKRHASDVHLQAGLPPVLRILTRLVPLEAAALDAAATERLIFSIMSAEQQTWVRERREVDISYSLPGAARFRINVFRQRDSVAAAFRLIPFDVPSPADLGLPSGVVELAKLKRGFVLLTGAAGQGKSTTIAALIEIINHVRPAHIITLEDPIEYIFPHEKGLVVQRELGRDTLSFAAGLRAALREDPDVILVGEMRDVETVQAALTAAETGHLVFATLHTKTAAQSIDRIVDVVSPHQQPQVRAQLASVLNAVVTQQLLVRRDGQGLCLAVELMLVNPAIRNLIRDGKVYQIQSVLQTGSAAGMITMESSLKALCDRGLITYEEALGAAHDPRELARLTGRS